MKADFGGGKTYDYVGGLVYDKDGLEFIPTAEGRVLPPGRASTTVAIGGSTSIVASNSFYRYEYHLKDHLGNLRAACRCGERQTETTPGDGYEPLVVQEQHYDPFGLSLSALSSVKTASPVNRFNFSSKEDESDLGWIDFKWRHYDPSIGRFFNVDRRAEKFAYMTPYQFASNDPIGKIELDGLEGVFANLFQDWIITPYVKYIQGGVDYANNEHLHNTNNQYTQNVPEETRQIVKTIRKANAIQKSIEGATGIISTNLTLISALEGGALAIGVNQSLAWEALADGPKVGQIANRIDDAFGAGTVKGVEVDYNVAGVGKGDVDIATDFVNISVKTGSGKGSEAQAAKEALLAKKQGRGYVFYATDKKFSGQAEQNMRKSGIQVVRNMEDLLKLIQKTLNSK